MFERFTDRARRVLVLAQDEARLLNKGSIGTEHLLVGLIREGEGVAARALLSFEGVTVQSLREKIGELGGPGPRAPSGAPPFTPRVKKVLELSLREAHNFGHSYIGTEHVLLGLIREGEGLGAQTLVALGVDLGQVRQKVIQLMSGYQGHDRVPGSLMSAPSTLAPGGTPVVCSFCGRQPPVSGRLVAGADAFICEFCVRAWGESLRGFREPDVQVNVQELVVPTGPPPADIAAATAQIERAFSTRTEFSVRTVSLFRWSKVAPISAQFVQRPTVILNLGSSRSWSIG
ncbi:MAG TPA: Clp protease N-terminal domain-containing protein [Actinomycetota bacterium]|nr:Clp protease N-terminal domain-containing protein [Actinomycetota bacterium]